jgi:hypothetical protein
VINGDFIRKGSTLCLGQTLLSLLAVEGVMVHEVVMVVVVAKVLVAVALVFRERVQALVVVMAVTMVLRARVLRVQVHQPLRQLQFPLFFSLASFSSFSFALRSATFSIYLARPLASASSCAGVRI